MHINFHSSFTDRLFPTTLGDKWSNRYLQTRDVLHPKSRVAIKSRNIHKVQTIHKEWFIDIILRHRTRLKTLSDLFNVLSFNSHDQFKLLCKLQWTQCLDTAFLSILVYAYVMCYPRWFVFLICAEETCIFSITQQKYSRGGDQSITKSKIQSTFSKFMATL